MTERRVGSREQWLAARLELGDAEKERTRRAPRGRKESGRWYRLHDEYGDTART